MRNTQFTWSPRLGAQRGRFRLAGDGFARPLRGDIEQQVSQPPVELRNAPPCDSSEARHRMNWV